MRSLDAVSSPRSLMSATMISKGVLRRRKSKPVVRSLVVTCTVYHDECAHHADRIRVASAGSEPPKPAPGLTLPTPATPRGSHRHSRSQTKHRG